MSFKVEKNFNCNGLLKHKGELLNKEEVHLLGVDNLKMLCDQGLLSGVVIISENEIEKKPVRKKRVKKQDAL